MLEQLEDRCVPSANMMMPMSMPMPQMNTQTAITQLFRDFAQMLPQFQASTPMQQFIEIEIFEILATDLAQMQMLGTMMGPTMMGPMM
jgi:hypothetical protein